MLYIPTDGSHSNSERTTNGVDPSSCKNKTRSGSHASVLSYDINGYEHFTTSLEF